MRGEHNTLIQGEHNALSTVSVETLYKAQFKFLEDVGKERNKFYKLIMVNLLGKTILVFTSFADMILILKKMYNIILTNLDFAFSFAFSTYSTFVS